jgi:hypothetical protein
MRWPRVRLTLRQTMVAMAVLCMCLGACVLTARHYVDSINSYHMRMQHPVARELYRGTYGPGWDVESLVGRAPPHVVRRRGSYVYLVYYPYRPPARGGLSLAATEILAKDGKLVQAASYDCTWRLVHFDHLGPGDHAAFGQFFCNNPGKHPELGDIGP